MWQFQRTTPADGYSPGWHNYQPDPDSGADSIKIVEELWQQHWSWATAGGGRMETGSRLVQSGKFKYSLEFDAGAGIEAGEHGTQTNSQTNVRRRMRRVPFSNSCTCARCTQPYIGKRGGGLRRQATFSDPPLTARPGAAHPCASAAQLPTANPMHTHRGAPGPGLAPGSDWLGQLLTMARNTASGFPQCWDDTCDNASGHLVVPEGSAEYQAVTMYFNERLGPHPAKVGAVFRVQNKGVYKKYKRDAGETIMFHGCKSQSNESSIVQSGFLVDTCKSGGPGYGSWFAFRSSYSDGGYAWEGTDSWRHMFICLVSCFQKKKETPVMRVVGQGGAYPQWIIHYKHQGRA